MGILRAHFIRVVLRKARKGRRLLVIFQKTIVGRMFMPLIRITIFVLLGLMLLCSSAFAQRPGPQFRRPLACEPVEPRTKLEAIEWKYERVLVKGFSQIATFIARDVEVRIDAVELKEAATATRAIGLVIALRETGDNPHENRSFVDYEEIDR